MDTYAPRERDLNGETRARHLALQLRRQDSNLLMVEAMRQARQLVSRGVRDLFE